jgi:hypothetical protein
LRNAPYPLLPFTLAFGEVDRDFRTAIEGSHGRFPQWKEFMLSAALPGVIQGQRTRIVDSTPPNISGVAVSNLLFIYYRVLFQAIDRIEVE